MTLQGQTAATFRDKWTRNPDLASRQTLDESSEIFAWILGRNWLESSAELRGFLAGKRRILDPGCGNGRVTALLRRYTPIASRGSRGGSGPSEVARGNLGGLPGVTIVEGDIVEASRNSEVSTSCTAKRRSTTRPILRADY